MTEIKKLINRQKKVNPSQKRDRHENVHRWLYRETVREREVYSNTLTLRDRQTNRHTDRKRERSTQTHTLSLTHTYTL